MEKPFLHLPVLAQEVSTFLAPRPGGVYVDATVGGAGHAEMIARAIAPDGVLVGIDRDRSALAAAEERLRETGIRFFLVHENFAHLAAILRRLGMGPVQGILFDLGVSSPQLDDPARGFSYQKDAPLDMRMDRDQALTARWLVNEAAEEELARIIREYGEERWAARIARFIVRHRQKRPIETTGELAEIVKAAIPARARRSGPHPARRTFQALRIAVNDELGSLAQGLVAAVDSLAPGGRIVVISFHSLEDRLVKEEFARRARRCRCPEGAPVCRCGGPELQILTKKPVTPTQEELAANPRARSAKLRAAEKLGLEREGEKY
ncbi:MAG: 16S rRNA (cytosine(1402)-N(4))-methyltransferase RsmH [Bacillota bacterium]